jgi:hypothetical protein
MNRNHAALLRELNLPVDECDITPDTEIDLDCTLKCCGEIVQIRGFHTCSSCGLVKQTGVIEEDYVVQTTRQYRHENQKPLGGDEHWHTERRRYYHPLTHFRQHLNCYLGGRSRVIPEKIITELKVQIDPLDKKAYIKVREWLKKNKLNMYYKDIFTILYKLGSPIPKFNDYHSICQDFKHWYFNFDKKSRYGGHNTPSMLMLLVMFLNRYNHKPYYELPVLKSTKLRSRVEQINQEIWGSMNPDL